MRFTLAIDSFLPFSFFVGLFLGLVSGDRGLFHNTSTIWNNSYPLLSGVDSSLGNLGKNCQTMVCPMKS
jgi:hypothetical protein